MPYRGVLPGLGLTITIAIISYMMSSLHPAFDPLVISIIFGLLVGNMFDDRSSLQKGINFVLKVFLPLGIGLYGLQLRVAHLETTYWVPVLAVFLLTFAVTYFMSRGFGISRALSFLLGSGLSICGASAIAVVAPLIYAEREDTSVSVLSVMTVGLTGMIFYRFMPEFMGISMERYAFLSGTTLPMFGQVKVAAQALGTVSLDLASNYKLLRISALLPVALVAVLLAGKATRRFYVPWFMVAFVALALAANLWEPVSALGEITAPVSGFCLSAALAAIGLSLDFDSITERGLSPLFACFLSWGIVVMSVYLFFSVVS